ncbi:MAG: DUF2834 domain-containing protein [Brevinema sp.]
MIKGIYLLLSIIGSLIPYTYLYFFIKDGGGWNRFAEQSMANHINRLYTFDLLIAAVVLLIFIGIESYRLKIKYWWVAVFCTCFVGVSSGFPIFLYLKECSIKKIY